MSTTLDIKDLVTEDQLGVRIATRWLLWDLLRAPKKADWDEIQRYIFATDTTTTGNSTLPWSNKTTIPKLCQIRDNLHANYMAAMFPKSEWLEWEGDSEEDNSKDKSEAIESYMGWVTDRNQFYDSASRLAYDYIDYGNAFAIPEWRNDTFILEDGTTKVGYVGPMLRRISPLDITFNPTSPSFEESPKIVRSLVSIGMLKEILENEATTQEELEDAQKIFEYAKTLRRNVRQYAGELTYKDSIYNIAGFASYRQYLESNEVEILTFYGDMYDEEDDVLYKNHVIKVMDRHKLVSKRPNPSFFGRAPIFHSGWRKRPDNLWAMGPLDNLVGMQYRIDHLENMKSDVFDLITYPPIKVKGYVEDFEWRPFEKIFVGDDSDVELMSPDVNVLQADNQIKILEQTMEEMAGSPKEAMGFRTPGEKTAYEVQRMENAASRIFQNKIAQFERDLIEPALNGMLELARRHATPTTISVFDDQYKIDVFMELSPQDLTGVGRLKPFAARHFAEKAQAVQNITSFYNSSAGQDPMVTQHFSGVELAKMWEELLELECYNVVQPYVRISEMADAERIKQSQQQMVLSEGMTPGGILPGDHDANPNIQFPDSMGAITNGPAMGSAPEKPQG